MAKKHRKKADEASVKASSATYQRDLERLEVEFAHLQAIEFLLVVAGAGLHARFVGFFVVFFGHMSRPMSVFVAWQDDGPV